MASRPRAFTTPASKPEISALASTPSSSPTCRRLQLTDGFKLGLVPSEYAGGIDTDGVADLRGFVPPGRNTRRLQPDVLIIDLFGLPVTNILAGAKPDEFALEHSCALN